VSDQFAYSEWSSYLSDALFNVDKLLKTAVEKLEGVQFDSIVGTGLSGTLVIPFLAREMRKHFAIVRKSNDSDHAEASIEGMILDKWIIVDDLISSGRTVRRIKDAVQEKSVGKWDSTIGRYDYQTVGDNSRYMGYYMYARGGYWRPESLHSDDPGY